MTTTQTDQKIWVRESYENATEGYSYGDSDVYETEYTVADKAMFFAMCQREYGGCIGKMFDDNRPVGWVFAKRVKYDDSNDTYMRHVWLSLHSGPDTVVRTVNYL